MATIATVAPCLSALPNRAAGDQRPCRKRQAWIWSLS